MPAAIEKLTSEQLEAQVKGLEFGVGLTGSARSAQATDTIPVAIRLADFPQLAALAWQVRGVTEVSPREAFDIYERNNRHLDRSNPGPIGPGTEDQVAGVSALTGNIQVEIQGSPI